MTATTTGAASQASTTPKSTGNGQEPLLQVTDLQMHFPLTRGIIFQRKVYFAGLVYLLFNFIHADKGYY